MAEQQGTEEASRSRRKAEQQVVRYVGDATIRRITADQWVAAGVSDQEDVVWDEANNYEVPVSLLSAEGAMDIIRRDGRFQVIAV